MQVLLAILRLCNSQKVQIQKAEKKSTAKENKKKKRKTFDEHASKWIISPDSKFKIGWDIFVSLVYLDSLFQDPFNLVFGMYPMVVPWCKHTQTVFSFIMVIDIIFTFFTAYEKEMRIEFDQ